MSASVRLPSNNRAALLASVMSAMLFEPIPGVAEEVRVTPYRPTITNSAALSEPGWIELETGAATLTGKDGSHQDALPYLLKYAFTPDIGVLLGGDALASQTEPDGTRVTGGGDTTVLIKQRFALADDATTVLGCEYGFKSPTAAKGLGSGKSDLILNGIYSKDFSGDALDINLNVTKLGDALANEGTYEYGWSGTVFHPVAGKWGVMAEISGVVRKGVLPQNQWLAAASYEVNPGLVLDAGLSAGIGSPSHRIAWFAGMSMLLGKVR